MSKSFIPSIGKNVIETLTIGMYDAPYFIYREYVQNAADSIDMGVATKLFKSRNEGRVQISINRAKGEIVIEDNGIGIESRNVQSLLGNVAQSTKNRYSQKGFRGIGRLGGLGYCSKLTYETSFSGENVRSVMVWDARSLREILESPNSQIDASEVISVITDFEKHREDANSHFFRVILEGVNDAELLDEKKVMDYLSMVAPVPFSDKFSFKKDIYKRAKLDKVAIDEYNIFLNNVQLSKLYKDDIYDIKGGKMAIVDTVVGVEFFKEKYSDELLYWGWYGVTTNMQHLPTINVEKFIRLRKSNIQIGLENRLDEFHKKDTGNRYFIGEVYATHPELHPNGRRDFFVDNDVSSALKTKLKDFFHNSLYELYYDFSRKNSAVKSIDDYEKANKALTERKKSKADQTVIEKLITDAEQKEEKAEKAKIVLYKLYNKYAGKTLAKVIIDKVPSTELEKAEKSSGSILKHPKKLNDSEKRLLQFVFNFIRNIRGENDGGRLIKSIEQEVNNNYH